MAIEEPQAQLTAWIEALDAELEALTARREAFVVALTTFGGRPAIAVGKVAAPVVSTVVLDGGEARREAQRKADRERKARERGAKPAAPAAGPKYDYAIVASVAREAHAQGRPMGAAVAKRFDVSTEMGGWLIREARKRGHEVPGRASPVSPTPLRVVGAPVTADNHPASRAFTPDDAMRLIDG